MAIEARAEADLALGRHGELVDELEALCRQHPLRERLWELLILALYRAGRQAEALRAYTEIRDHLVDELGIDPGPALRELEARVLAQDPSLALAGTGARAAGLRHQGSWQPAEPMSSFIGRGTEIEQVCEAVRACRLVTLDRPRRGRQDPTGGRGGRRPSKSIRDGAWLVELAGVTDPAGVAPAAAAALGASRRPSPEGPCCQDQRPRSSLRHLAGRSLVVVLDNCEHVIDAAAALADALVGEVPGLRLITTSREPLGVPGEVSGAGGGMAAASSPSSCSSITPGRSDLGSHPTAAPPSSWRTFVAG